MYLGIKYVDADNICEDKLKHICIFVIFELTANNLYNSKMKDIQILGIFRIARGILCVCVNYQLSIVTVVFQAQDKNKN